MEKLISNLPTTIAGDKQNYVPNSTICSNQKH